MTNVGEWDAKGLAAKLALPHVLSAWGSREEMVRAARLAVCCNYFYKKKKNVGEWDKFWNIDMDKEVFLLL